MINLLIVTVTVSYWLELISPNTLPHRITTISRWVKPDFDIGVLIELIFLVHV